jgi:RNA recognition motif-containing protein
MQRELAIEASIETPTAGDFSRLTEGPRRRPEASPRKRQDYAATKGTTSLYVGNLPWATKPHELEALFGGYGTVESVTLVSDRRTGRCKGYGFVEMSGNSPTGLVERARGASLGGRPLKIKPAH